MFDVSIGNRVWSLTAPRQVILTLINRKHMPIVCSKGHRVAVIGPLELKSYTLFQTALPNKSRWVSIISWNRGSGISLPLPNFRVILITHTCPDFKGCFVKAPVKLRHGLLITFRIKLYLQLLTYATICFYFFCLFVCFLVPDIKACIKPPEQV